VTPIWEGEYLLAAIQLDGKAARQRRRQSLRQYRTEDLTGGADAGETEPPQRQQVGVSVRPSPNAITGRTIAIAVQRPI
jgi:hypothetical protein